MKPRPPNDRILIGAHCLNAAGFWIFDVCVCELRTASRLTMAEDASHQVARQVVARLCQPLGWQGMQNGACDVLADLLRRYILSLGKTTAAYVANGTSEPLSPSPA